MMDLLNVDLNQVRNGKVKRSDKIEPLLGLNYRGVLDAATNVPVVGDVLSGGLAAYDLSQGDYGSAALNALGVLPFVSGTFIGKGAKTWDKVKEADAMSRLAKGEDAAKVWKDTGIGQAPWDKSARAEIADNLAKTQPDGVLHRAIDKEAMSQGAPTSFPQWVYMDHPELYGAYDGAKRIAVRPTADFSGGGSYNNAGIINISAFADDPKSVNLHELQHAIQQREGWAKGGNPENAPQLNMELLDSIRREKKQLGIDPYRIQNNLSAGYHVPDEQKAALAKYNALNAQEDEILANRLDPYEAYKRLAGEAEARLTQYRMALTPQERLAQYPYDPAYFKQATGVDINDLIVRGLLNN